MSSTNTTCPIQVIHFSCMELLWMMLEYEFRGDQRLRILSTVRSWKKTNRQKYQTIEVLIVIYLSLAKKLKPALFLPLPNRKSWFKADTALHCLCGRLFYNLAKLCKSLERGGSMNDVGGCSPRPCCGGGDFPGEVAACCDRPPASRDRVGGGGEIISQIATIFLEVNFLETPNK